MRRAEKIQIFGNYGSKITLSARRAKNASGGRCKLEPPKWLAWPVPLVTCAGEAPVKYEMKADVNEISWNLVNFYLQKKKKCLLFCPAQTWRTQKNRYPVGVAASLLFTAYAVQDRKRPFLVETGGNSRKSIDNWQKLMKTDYHCKWTYDLNTIIITS